MSTRQKLIVFFLAFLTVFSLFAKKPKLAVMEIQDKTGKFRKGDIIGAGRYLRSQLIASGKYIVISKERQDKFKVKQLKKESYKGCYGKQCQIPLGQALAADTILNGSVTLFMGRYTLTVELIDLAKEATVKGANSNFKSTPGLRDALDDVISEIVGKRKASAFKSESYQEKDEGWDVGGGGGEFILKLESEPTGAIVMLDGNLLCQSTPCSKMVSGGKHKLVMQKERFVKKQEQITIKSDKRINLKLTPNYGWVTINSDPSGMEVTIDGRSEGETPINKKELSPGAHKIMIGDSCYYKSGEKIAIKRGKERKISKNLKQRQAAIKAVATDEKGNALRGTLIVDGEDYGRVPGTHKVPLCSKKAEIKTEKGSFSKELDLKEKKVFRIVAKIKSGEAGMVTIPAGSFKMGCVPSDSKCQKDEKPRHSVYLDSFQIDKIEVTVSQYKKCVDAGECKAAKTTTDKWAKYYNWNKSGRENHPINGVDWNDATNYCKWKGKRLPTEAEWEKAARGGTDSAYYWGNSSTNQCGYANGADESAKREFSDWTVSSCDDGYIGTSPAKSFKPNDYGLYDMTGNVYEWCSDWYGESYYKDSPSKNPTGATSGSSRVLRGGSWGYDSRLLRASHRYCSYPDGGYYVCGFRCASE